MELKKAGNFGNPHIGLFAKASESLTVVDISASSKLISGLESLGNPLLKTTFGGSGLAGIYLAMNKNGAVLPPFCSKEETEAFRKQGLNVAKLSGNFSAAGNNIAANDFGAVANPNLPHSEALRVSDCLGVEVVCQAIAGYETAGSCVVATNSGFAAHNRSTEEELKELRSILRVDGRNCTANAGVPFVSLGVVANSKCALLGESCTGFEAGRLLEALSLV